MEDIIPIKKMNLFIRISFILCIVVTFLHDSILFKIEHPTEIPDYLSLDPELALPLSLKGKMMVIAAILTAISVISYSIICRKLYLKSKKKDKNFYSLILLYCFSYLLVARCVELYYVPLTSDFFNFHYVAQFYIPLDGFALALYLLFTFQIFSSERLTQREFYSKIIFGIGIAITFTVIGSILSYLVIHRDADLMVSISIILCLIFIFLLIIIGVIVLIAIFNYRSKLAQQKKELMLIAFNLILIFSTSLLTIATVYFFYLQDDPIMSYTMRIIKLVLHILNAIVCYYGILKPRKFN
jgi:hypothetical protein